MRLHALKRSPLILNHVGESSMLMWSPPPSSVSNVSPVKHRILPEAVTPRHGPRPLQWR